MNHNTGVLLCDQARNLAGATFPSLPRVYNDRSVPNSPHRQPMSFPTPYPDVNAIVEQVHTGASAILGDSFVGMYLVGSLAAGDFDPLMSDIDFIVVSAAELGAATIDPLAELHAGIASGTSKWASELEGSYFPRHALRRYDPANALHPHIFRGRGEEGSRLFMMQHASDWIIQRHVLRAHGIVVAGPPPRSLVDPVRPHELRQAVRSLAPLWPAPLLDDPTPIRQHDGYHAYTVVTLCRMLYTLEHSSVVSKPVAALWAQSIEDARWATHIQRALRWSMRSGDVATTIALARYTLERCQA